MSNLVFHPKTIEGRVANVLSNNIPQFYGVPGLESFRLDLSGGTYSERNSVLVSIQGRIALLDMAVGDKVAIDGYYTYKDESPQRRDLLPRITQPRILKNFTTRMNYTLQLDPDAEVEAKQ
jgi:hypothetical protein